MKRFLSVALVICMVVVSFASCGTPQTETATDKPETNTPEATETNNEENAPAPQKAACILGVGGRGDQGYNDLVYDGMLRAEQELGVPFDCAEPKQISEFELIMREMSSSGQYGVIVCVGFDQVDALEKVAAEFDDQLYAIIDGVVEGENIASYTCKEEEGSFLAGALAGLMTKNYEEYSLSESAGVGFIGALEIPLIVRFGAGYQAGAQYVNPDVNVEVDYISGDNPFSDTTTAKEIAISQNNKGAEIVYHGAGGAGLGVFQGAAESGFYAMGCNSNQNHLDPEHIVASMLKRVDNAAFEIVKAAIIDNDLAVNTEVVLGVADDGVSLSLEGSNVAVRDEDIAVVEELRNKVAAGEIVVPQDFAEVDEFLANNTFA